VRRSPMKCSAITESSRNTVVGLRHNLYAVLTNTCYSTVVPTEIFGEREWNCIIIYTMIMLNTVF
jgi:hypothetical protein